jgi:hypothetical protein
MAADLLTVYAHLWKFWRMEAKTRPVLLPMTFMTHDATTATMSVRGEAWELRSVEVSADGEEWVFVDKFG